MDQKFNEMVAEKLKAYVYVLCDPRPEIPAEERIFYVGKGRKDRCFSHSSGLWKKGEEPLKEDEHKLKRIRDIHGSGNQVQIEIVAHGLSDDTALLVEACLIPVLGSTNAQQGHHHKAVWLGTNDILQAYDDPIDRDKQHELWPELLIVSLNKQMIESLDDDSAAISRAVLGDWNNGTKTAKKVKFVIGVSKGLVRYVFETEKTNFGYAKYIEVPAPEKGKHRRHRYSGVRRKDLEDVFRGRSIEHGSKKISLLRPGAGCQYFDAI